MQFFLRHVAVEQSQHVLHRIDRLCVQRLSFQPLFLVERNIGDEVVPVPQWILVLRIELRGQLHFAQQR